jgi:YaiO family outer membrane protein
MIIWWLGSWVANGQPPAVDSTYAKARALAFAGEHEAARQVLRPLLAAVPGHTEARLLLARTLAWDGAWSAAQAETDSVLQRWPHEPDACALQIDIAHWRGQVSLALALADRALAHDPASPTLLLKKAQLCRQLGRVAEAMQTLHLIPRAAQSPEARQLGYELHWEHYRTEWTGGAGVDVFSRLYAPATYQTVQGAFRHPIGLLALRVNAAQRFGLSGWQPEVEAYPRLSATTYAYLNYGHSPHALFPRHRLGAELFHRVARGVEASLGHRFLTWSETNRVHIATASVSAYYRAWLFTVRPSLVAGTTGLTYSALAQGRYHFRNGWNYLGAGVAYGLLPDERRLQPGAGTSPDRFGSLRSRAATLTYYHRLAHRYALRLQYQWEARDLADLTQRPLQIHSVQVTLARRY